MIFKQGDQFFGALYYLGEQERILQKDTIILAELLPDGKIRQIRYRER